ncbi:MAG: hypothetical protein B7733_14640 [Myxococcales bacterium FL481]|nr:MAG: hypothetical protein B7733_14640 [Myxococcales bacterium FL481]
MASEPPGPALRHASPSLTWDEPPRRFALALRLAGSAAFGPLPRSSPSLGGAIAGVWPRVRLELAAGYHLPQEMQRSDGQGAQFDAWMAATRACPRWRVQPIEAQLCAVLHGGAIRGSGRGLAENRTSRRPWLGLGGGFAATWHPVRAFGLWIGVDTLAMVIRPRFVATHLGELHRSGPLAVRGGAGIEWVFL